MTEPAALLLRFKPALRYDSCEQYFADSAGQWTANPGNELRRGGGAGIVIARASRGGTSPS